jgi:hypothetical protein
MALQLSLCGGCSRTCKMVETPPWLVLVTQLFLLVDAAVVDATFSFKVGAD